MTATPILYDPDCGFCRVCVAVVLTWDRAGALRPVPGENLDAWQLVLADGTVLSAGAAFSPLFRLLPGGGPLARLADRFPGGAERAYRWVADRRGVFGRMVPRPVRHWADRVIQPSESAPDSR